MGKTPQDFYNAYVGKRIDYDGTAGVQCVDGFKVFCSWAGVPPKPTGTGYADGYWYNRNSSGYSKYFTFITGSSNFKNGDWVIWARGSVYPKSHISMYYNGKMFGENQGGNRGFNLITAKWSGALGAFRWKGWATTTTATTAKVATTTTSAKVETKDTKAEDTKAEEKEEEKETVQKRTTIESVNAGKDYLEHAEGIKLFGRISKVVEWDDVTIPSNLKAKAQAALDNAVNMAITLEVDAVDSAMLKFDVEAFRLGDLIGIVSPPHGLDTMLLLSKASIPLDAPEDASYTLGASFTAMTEQQVAQKREQYRVSNQVKQVSVITETTPVEIQDTVNKSDIWLEITEVDDGSKV